MLNLYLLPEPICNSVSGVIRGVVASSCPMKKQHIRDTVGKASLLDRALPFPRSL